MKAQRIHSPPRRVVVTGIGAVAPNGIGAEEYCAALRNGASGIATITTFDAGELDCQVAAEIKNFSADDFITRQEMRRVGRAVPLVIAATAEAKAAIDGQRSSGRSAMARRRAERSAGATLGGRRPRARAES